MIGPIYRQQLCKRLSQWRPNTPEQFLLGKDSPVEALKGVLNGPDDARTWICQGPVEVEEDARE